MMERMPKLTKDDFCLDCKMPVEVGEYHPYAACLMFKQCQDSRVVRENLYAVMRHAKVSP
jgi:hypothetical protein